MAAAPSTPLGVFGFFLRLGLTSFGGPAAHLGYFREACVVRGRWCTEQDYADWVALCQFLPGPASSQLVYVLGHHRAGVGGGLLGLAGFLAPSAGLMLALAAGLGAWQSGLAPFVPGLKLGAVAVVMHAVWTLAAQACPDGRRRGVALVAGAAVLLLPTVWMPLAAMAVAGLLYSRREYNAGPRTDVAGAGSTRQGTVLLALWVALAVLFPLAAAALPGSWVALCDSFYRSGSWVFGGGHVILPLLANEFVRPGAVPEDVFLAGYGAAQVVPGPLFSFAAFLGATVENGRWGWGGGLLALAALYLPALLVVAGAAPWWQRLRTAPRMRGALAGANAAVVGVLLATLIDPVVPSAVHTGADAGLAVVGFVALTAGRVPPLIVVAALVLGRWLLGVV